MLNVCTCLLRHVISCVFTLQVGAESTFHQLVFVKTTTSTYVFCMYEDNNLASVDSLLVT